MIDFTIATESDLERHKAHFPSGSDMTLQVLKGHLLVEELLRELFELQLPFPAALKGNGGTSFTCHQIICLVQAITRHGDKEPWVWAAAKKINTIRNNLAHKLSHERLDKDVADLVKFAASENPTIMQDAKDLGIPPGHEFELVVMSICTYLSAIKTVLIHLNSGARVVA